MFKKDDWRLRLETDYGDIYVMVPEKPDYKRSDKITLTGTMQAGFGEYNAFFYRPTITSIDHPETSDFALIVRDNFAQNIQSQLEDESQSALALSYVTGQKSLLNESLSEKLRLAGLAHVVVVSGYHLSVVVGFAKRRLGRISRFLALSGAALLIIIYISITGLSPSMARAGISTILSLTTWYFGRRFHPLRLLLYTATLTLLVNPNYVSNLAWQLSFLSYSGIILFSPLLIKFLYGDKTPNYFANLILACISAQLFCLPLTIFTFGNLSGLAIVTNLLVTPAIPITMLLTFIVGITKITPIAFVLSKILAYQLFVVDTITNLPWSNMELAAGNPAIFIIYLPIFVLLLLLKRRTRYNYRPSYALEKPPDYDKIYSC